MSGYESTVWNIYVKCLPQRYNKYCKLLRNVQVIIIIYDIETIFKTRLNDYVGDDMYLIAHFISRSKKKKLRMYTKGSIIKLLYFARNNTNLCIIRRHNHKRCKTYRTY